MKFASVLFASMATVAVASGPLSLNADNFDSSIEGKNALVKFLAPWWGHCKRMKPAFDRLGGEYADHDNVVIADVDCTADGKSLCQSKGIRGYPTVRYYVNGEQNDYRSGRDYDSLKKFVEDNLE